jgi:hypothetical protein
MVSYLIVFEDLPDELTPEELQAFSNPARRQPIILSQLASGQSNPILEAIWDLYESEVHKMITLKEETLDRLLKGVDQEKLIAAITRTVGQEKLLAAFNKEEILRQMLAELGPDQLRKMLDQINGNKSESH